jgi:hypothetical protein
MKAVSAKGDVAPPAAPRVASAMKTREAAVKLPASGTKLRVLLQQHRALKKETLDLFNKVKQLVAAAGRGGRSEEMLDEAEAFLV